MSDNLPGNPHVFEGPQIATPETIENDFLGEEGITAETMMLSELTRNTESNLAIAFEIRTQTLAQINLHNRREVARVHGANFEEMPEEVREMIAEQSAQIEERLGR